MRQWGECPLAPARIQPMVDETVTWVPPMDVYEINDDYVLNAELPGVDSSDLRIDISGLEVTIRGKRRTDADCGYEHYHRLEGHRGRFHRTFSLPESVDRNRIQIDLKNGVLRVVLPKAGRQDLSGNS
jgi:HSP20 family protein